LNCARKIRAQKNRAQKNRAQKRAGQSLIESALILTAFMGLLVGMAGIGQMLFVRQTLADRARMAARWGAMNTYDPAAIRRMVLFGTAAPAPADAPFFGLTAAAVDVSNPGCPGSACRVSVAIPEHGIRSVEPMGFTPAAAALTPAALTPAGSTPAGSNPAGSNPAASNPAASHPAALTPPALKP